jgi:hypothetical protein
VNVTETLARVAEIRQLLAAPARAVDAAAEIEAAPPFDATLASLTGAEPAAAPSGVVGELPQALTAAFPPQGSGGSAGARALAIAEAEIGSGEDPPGSNDGARLAVYRTATAGAMAGAPWCAYFVSWCAAQAGVPLGEEGQGFGAVEQIHDWAARTGRLLPATATPRPGDLILYGGRHVGIVESVDADGSLTTVEGNYRNRVDRVHRSPAEATGYVRL